MSHAHLLALAPALPHRQNGRDARDTLREVVMLWFQSVGDAARLLQSKGGLIFGTATVLLAAATATDRDLKALGEVAKVPAFISAVGLAFATSYKAIALGRQRVRAARIANDEKEAELQDANEARDRAERGKALAEEIAHREAKIKIQEMEDHYRIKAERAAEARQKNTLTGQVEALTKRVDAMLAVNAAQAAEVVMLTGRVSDLTEDLTEARQTMASADLEHRTERDMLLAEIARLTQEAERIRKDVGSNSSRISGVESRESRPKN